MFKQRCKKNQEYSAYYRHILKDAEEEFVKIAKVVFGVDTAEAGIKELTECL